MLLPEVTLYMTPNDVSSEPYVQLAGWIENPKNASSYLTHTLKEVVVWQHPPVIEVYNVREHGRRMLRVLEYTSNMSLCLHEVTGEPYPDRVGGILALSAGVPMTTAYPSPSLIVTRSLSSKLGTQTHIAGRFLAGVLPTALVEKYTFWQGEDDNLIGYEVPSGAEGSSSSPASGALTRLKVTLLKSPDIDKTGFCNSSADALVQRIPVLNASPEVEEIDTNRPLHTLLNVSAAPPTSLLKRLGMLLSRLDNLSHVLV